MVFQPATFRVAFGRIPVYSQSSHRVLLLSIFSPVIYLWGSRLSIERGIVTQAFTEYGDPNSEDIESFLKSEILFTTACASNGSGQSRGFY
jgi:hypothetical protein